MSDSNDSNILFSFPVRLVLFMCSVAYFTSFTCSTNTVNTDLGLSIVFISSLLTVLIIRYYHLRE